MSLRLVHLVFIALSVVLTAFFAAWAAGRYRAAHEAAYGVAALAALAAGAALAAYGAAFRRKTKSL